MTTYTTSYQNATLRVQENQGASSNTNIKPSGVNVIGINNDIGEATTYSTSASVDSLDSTTPYVRGCAIAVNQLGIGGNFGDYTSGNGNIRRVYTGFYGNSTPALGAVQATTQNGLLDPNATKVDISVRSNLDLQSTQEIKNASNIKTTTITDKNTSTGNEGQILSSTSTGIDWITPTPIVSTLEYYITATSPFFQYPPVAPTQALITSYQYYGWYFINSVALRNIAWFFAPDYAMTVADVKGLYMNYFNITTTSNDNLPFITIYTKPTGVNDFFPNFAHSSRTFAPTFTTAPASPYCSFMNISGVQPDPFPYGHILGTMVIANTRGEYLPTEEVLSVSVGTSTTSPVNEVNFIMSKVGICLTEGNQELILNPQNILDPTVNSIKPTTILDLNNQAGTAGQILSSTSSGIDWVDAPATPNIGAVITAGGDANGGTITNLSSLSASGTLLLGTNSATTAITVGSSSATELLLIPPLKVGTLGNAGVAGQYLTSSGGSANTWTTPYVNASNGRVAGNLLLQGNDITGVDAIDGNSGALSIGRGAGTTSAISIGKAGIPIDLNNTIRCGAEGSLSAGSANQVITSQGAGLPTVYKFPTLATASVQQAPTISGTRFTNNIQVAYNRTVITSPAVGTKYLFFLTTTVDSNNSGNTQTAYVSIGYKDGDNNVLANDVNSFNIVNNLNTAVQNVSSTTVSMASARSGTVTTTTQTLTSFWVYTWAGALTKSFACIFSGGVDWYLGTGRISYIQIS